MKKPWRNIIILIMMSIILLLPVYARADMGPKPSIALKVVNAPSVYYVALLGCFGDREEPDTMLQISQFDREAVEAYLEAFYYEGWVYFQSPVGTNFYEANAEGTYFFSYMVPDPFRVLLIAEDGQVYISNAYDRKEYNADCTYDVASGKVTEETAGKTAQRIRYVAICYLLTLLIEYIGFKLFRYPSGKANMLRFLLINTVTQLSLNIFFAFVCQGVGLLFLVFGFWAEIAIMLTEGIFYGLTLENKEGDKKFWKGFLYGIVANVVSAVAGLFCIPIL